MTVELSKDGQITLPSDFRDLLGFEPGDDLEMSLIDDAIVIRRSEPPSSGDWLEHLLSCPHPFDVPERSKELPREIDLS